MPYMRRGSVLRRPGVAARRGMGQDDDDTSDYYVSPIDVATVPTNVLSLTPGANLADNPLSQTPVPTTPASSSGFNLSSLLGSLTQSAAAAQRLYLQGQSPSLVPGTNAIYNPATGQYYNPTTGQVVNAPGITGSTSAISADLTAYLPTILLVGGIGLAAVLVMHMVSNR